MLSLIIPAINKHDLTLKSVNYAVNNSVGEFELIIIDNGSEIDYVGWWYEHGNPNIIPLIIRNNRNVGVPQSILQGIKASHVESNVCVFIHNDVFIHEEGWNERIEKEFEADEMLGMAGFFGAPGVEDGGGRVAPMSNMLGLDGGVAWHEHGLPLSETWPASTLDGLCMIFRKEIIDTIAFDDLPPHHWYDRIIPLRAIKAGWRVATIGIGFDHAIGATAGEKEYNETAEKWLSEHGFRIDPNSIDSSVYAAGTKIFEDEFKSILPLAVDSNYNYTWGATWTQ